MGLFPDLVLVLIELNLGSHFLHLLNKVEGLPVDDGILMIIRSLDHVRIVSDPFHRGILGTYRLSKNRVSQFQRLMFPSGALNCG